MKDTLTRMVAGLNDEELRVLRRIVLVAQWKEISQRMALGYLKQPASPEQTMIRAGRLTYAIKSYHDRIGCDMETAKLVCEVWRNQHRMS